MEEIYSTEFEEATLGSLLLEPDRLLEVREVLELRDFYWGFHRDIYRAICKIYIASEEVSAVSVELELRNNPDAYARLFANLRERTEKEAVFIYLLNLTEVPNASANAKYYASKVSELAVKRRVSQLGERIKTVDLTKAKEEVYTSVLDLVDKIPSKPSSGNIKSIGDLVHDRAIVAKNRIGTEWVTGIKTGFSDLDWLTQGLQPQELIIIAARPGMGKTSLALQLASEASLQKRGSVLFCSLEMSETQLTDRLLSGMARVPYSAIRSGQLTSSHLSAIDASVNRMANQLLMVDDTRRTTVQDISLKVRQLKRQGGVALVVVDYLQILTPSGTGERHQQVGQIASDLKTLAKELSVPVIALAQLNRSVEGRKDKRPSLTDLRESGQIESEADMVCFIHREAYYQESTIGAGSIGAMQTAELIIAKNRSGETGNLEIGFIPSYTLFCDIDRSSTEDDDDTAPVGSSIEDDGLHDYEQTDLFDEVGELNGIFH